MEQTQALVRLQRMTNYLGDPGLTTQEISDLLSWCVRYDADGNMPWQLYSANDASVTAGVATITSAGAAFTASDVGLMVQVELGGTTEAPYDSTIASVQTATQATGAVVAGTTVGPNAKIVLFRPNPIWSPTFAVEWAAAEGWRWQAGKVVSRYKFQADGATFVRDQVFTHCMKMATEYEKLARNLPQSIRAMGNLVLDRLGFSSAVPWWYEVMGN